MRCLSVLPLIVLTLTPLTRAEVHSKSKHTQSKAAPRIPYDLGAINNPATADQLDEQSKGSAVLRAQILLDRAKFSVGEIDGRMGTNVLRAIEGLRTARGLPAGTSVDADVWKTLNAEAAPALLEYTISEADVKGPFVRIPANMMLKAKLMYLGYGSAVEAIGEKFHIGPVLLQQLNPAAKFSVVGQKIYVLNVLREMTTKASRTDRFGPDPGLER